MNHRKSRNRRGIKRKKRRWIAEEREKTAGEKEGGAAEKTENLVNGKSLRVAGHELAELRGDGDDRGYTGGVEYHSLPPSSSSCGLLCPVVALEMRA